MERQTHKGFFISYTSADRSWAEWIAWQLEQAGYTTLIQVWDFGPGSNFVQEMDSATKGAERTIAVLSPDYFNSGFTPSEWQAAFRRDPKGEQRLLVPIRVRRCDVEGLLGQIVYIDLVGHDEQEASARLLAGVRQERAKPRIPPVFPAGSQSLREKPTFPGVFPSILMVPYPHNPIFTDHGELLTQLTPPPTIFRTSDPIIHENVLADFHQKDYSNTCAIRCQEVILHKYGVEVQEGTLVDEAWKRGWYDPDHGTLEEHVGKLLEEHGIHVYQYEQANTYNLAVELAQGHAVIISVDSTRLEHPTLISLAEHLRIDSADHAVIVSGIDTSDPEDIQVIVIDPDSEQMVARYPMENFLAAWREGDFFMVATDAPPPQELHLPEMAHFDYDSGHIQEIADIPFDTFLTYADTPEDVEKLLDTYMYHEHQHTMEEGEFSNLDDSHIDQEDAGNFSTDVIDGDHTDISDDYHYDDSAYEGSF